MSKDKYDIHFRSNIKNEESILIYIIRIALFKMQY